jgi:gliding motility-associated-like protein
MKKILSLALTLIAFNVAAQVYVPNAFTPNNDGRNDVFTAVSADTLDVYDLQIYSVTGELIFHSNNINYVWTGGVYYYAPAGIYTYKLVYKPYDAVEEKVIYGCVKLVR